MGIWGACGFNMVLFLAAMQGVPEDLYEAADLYGANAWQKFRHITLPMIWPTVVAALLFMLIGGMKAFEAIWLLTSQAPTTENHVVGTLMVRSMFVEQRIGQAAAIACLLFATVLVCSLLADRLLTRDGD
jgi:raffinose/stachyose/melibiose transport system permease protein